MAEEIGIVSMVLIAAFVAISAFVIWFFYQFRLAAKRGLHDLSKKMDDLEHQYVRIKPELDELKQELATKVDYDYVEGKMHQLVRIVASKQKKPAQEERLVATVPARKKKAVY